jgi:23S rRNA pseudoU1915 N3-methylase RlmH
MLPRYKRRGSKIISRIKLKGFPDELVVENGKRIKNWSRVRRQIDQYQSRLMAMAMELAKERVKPSVEQNGKPQEEKRREGQATEKQIGKKSERGTVREADGVMPDEKVAFQFDITDIDWDSFWK